MNDLQMLDYVTVWDGAHHGRDADLLVADPVAQKVRGPIFRPVCAVEKEKVSIAAYLQQRPHTTQELMVLVGCTENQVRYFLRCARTKYSGYRSSTMGGFNASRQYWIERSEDVCV